MALRSRSSSALLSYWMFLVVLAASWHSTAHASRFLTAFQQSFDSDASNFVRTQAIRAELLHRDHSLSPLAPAVGTTPADRWAAAVERSPILTASRGRRLADFQTPVTREGDFQGEYVMSISFGTPPQAFTGLVDTGSDLVWVQCVACSGCNSPFPQPDPLYDPSRSSSEMNISCTSPSCTKFPFIISCTQAQTCGIEYKYGDNSTIQGTLTTETITLSNSAGANPTATGFIMGCMDNNTGLFDNYDGIVGFGRGSYSLPSQLSQIAYLPVFSYCLVPFHAATTNASTMLFGTSDPTNALGLVYTPILYTGHYWVNMTGISVNGVDLNIPASVFEYDSSTDTGGVIFDSGTPITNFVQAVSDPFQQAIASLITYPVVAKPDFFCFNISGVTTPEYPKVAFHFSGVDGSVVDFDLADDNVFVEDSGESCLVVSLTNGPMIIGSIAMANHYIETDATTNLRMGWITKDCTV